MADLRARVELGCGTRNNGARGRANQPTPVGGKSAHARGRKTQPMPTKFPKARIKSYPFKIMRERLVGQTYSEANGHSLNC